MIIGWFWDGLWLHTPPFPKDPPPSPWGVKEHTDSASLEAGLASLPLTVECGESKEKELRYFNK